MIAATWDRSAPPTEQYLMLRDFFIAARSASVQISGGSFYSLGACRTEAAHVMTEYVGRDGSRIRADSMGERTEDGSLEHQTFSFWSAP